MTYKLRFDLISHPPTLVRPCTSPTLSQSLCCKCLGTFWPGRQEEAWVPRCLGSWGTWAGSPGAWVPKGSKGPGLQYSSI